ncbi:MAG TPA: hypothetical protein VFV12_08760 [Xanthobacteraceae bacterium]|nr:hypothetical protein [Xanthobacteraceae bacterium]
MGIFDIFGTGVQHQAANDQIAGINAGMNAAGGAFGSGRDALTQNYLAGLRPFQQNYAEAGKGTGALDDALGLNGAEGNARATAAFWNNPAIQSQLDLGDQQVLRNQAASGQLASGKTNADLQKLGQQVASQGWQNYVSSLQPYLNFSQGAASGIGGLYSGLGNQLNQNWTNTGNMLYGGNTSIGNANANADLSALGASANSIGAILGLGKAAMGGLGMGGFGGGGGGGMFGGFAAEGGPVDPSHHYVVGERGPEIFVPDRPGTVLPHQYARDLFTMAATGGPGGLSRAMRRAMPGDTEQSFYGY